MVQNPDPVPPKPPPKKTPGGALGHNHLTHTGGAGGMPVVYWWAWLPSRLPLLGAAHGNVPVCVWVERTRASRKVGQLLIP